MGKGVFKKKLSDKIASEELSRLNNSFDIVGDIAIIKVPSSSKKVEPLIAEAVMSTNKNVRTVLKQSSPVFGELRTRELEWVAGEKKTETTYRESGCVFDVNLSKVYFSPRLSFERMRIAHQVKAGEVVVNMFAGVGCFSIIIAKHSEAKKVYSIDINADAVTQMMNNIVLNKVEGKVEAVLGDAKEAVEKKYRGVANRVLMPLPALACRYLDAACLALQPEGGFIHYYDFIYSKERMGALGKVVDIVKERLAYLGKVFEITSQRIVRTVGPHWYQVVLDLYIF